MLGTLYVASCLLLCIVSGKDVEHAVGGVPQQTPKGALAQKGNTTSGLAASKTSSGALETIDNIISKGTEVRKAAKSFTEQPLKLFCNISGEPALHSGFEPLNCLTLIVSWEPIGGYGVTASTAPASVQKAHGLIVSDKYPQVHARNVCPCQREEVPQERQMSLRRTSAGISRMCESWQES